jgi:hypothetical protein
MCEARAHPASAAHRVESMTEQRRRPEHCRPIIEQTLSRVFERSTTAIADNHELYRFWPQGAD